MSPADGHLKNDMLHLCWYGSNVADCAESYSRSNGLSTPMPGFFITWV